MRNPLAAALCVVLFLAAEAAADRRGIRVTADRLIEPGIRTVILTVYDAPEGGKALASETHTVQIAVDGSFATTFDNVAAIGSENDERWLTVRIPPRAEGHRAKLAGSGGLPITVQGLPDAAITAAGIIESTKDGFRFPDATLQTTAAPTTFGMPVSVGTTNDPGVSNSVARSDHVHFHGILGGGGFHETATVFMAGFMAPGDKSKLDDVKLPVRTVLVSPVPGDPAASGTALLNAHAAITASVDNPHLLKIEPGVYDLGNSLLTMKDYVDIEGSGPNVTWLVSTRTGPSIGPLSATILGASNSELRDLTLTKNASGNSYASGVCHTTQSNFTIRNVTIHVAGGTNGSLGIISLIGVPTSSLSVIDTTVNVTGTSANTGVYASAVPSAVIRRSTIKASNGTSNKAVSTITSAVVTIEGSTLVANGGGTSEALALYASSGTANVFNSVLRGEGTTTGSRIGASVWSTSVVKISHSHVQGTGLALYRNSGVLRVAHSLVETYALGPPTCIYNYDANFAANPCNPPPP